jgi:hypothetical protein
MADEISIGVSFRYNRWLTALEPSLSPPSINVDMAGQIVSEGTQEIGFAAKEDLELRSDHSTLGWVFIMNLDTTNYLSYGSDADTPFAELKAGEYALFRLARGQSSISVKADTAACKVYFRVLED